MRRATAGLLPLLVFAVLAPLESARPGPQPPCTLEPLTLPAVTESLAFTAEQEMHLGDAIAEHVQRSLDVIDGPLNDRLQQIGDRIAAEFPATGLTFTFRLVDQPYWNAFAMPGGRVYVTRKLVAYAKTEDELAGVIAHEIGHLVARHSAIDLTATFRRALGVTSFGDRDDIFHKYQQLVDAKGRQGRSARREHRKQLEADQLALAAATRAGYSPSAYVELWDRYTETEGRTGNFFSDLFGATRPESRRLREMLREVATLPPECRRVSGDGEAFAMWQRRVVAYDGPERVAGVVDPPARTIRLEPPLRPDITHLKFSPDGRSLLAQDAAGISVMSREPLAMRFRIDLDYAEPAQFSRDSRQVLVHTAAQRVERWDLASGKRLDVVELAGKFQCLETRLSPDGRFLGCIEGSWIFFDVVLLDVATGEIRFRKPSAYKIDFDAVREAMQDKRARLNFDVFQLEFSPDGRYFIVGGPAGELVVDLNTMSEARLPERLRKAFRGPFDFLGADRVVTVNVADGRQSSVVSYPEAAPLAQVRLGGKISGATLGDFVVIRPLGEWAAGLVDLAQNKVVLASRTPALDVFDRQYASERTDGDIGLFDINATQSAKRAALPETALGPLDTFDLSPNLKYLALSGRDRGAVWDLASGKRVLFVRAFTGVFLAPDGNVYADFPSRQEVKEGKSVETPRELVRLDLSAGRAHEIAAIDDDEAGIVGRHITSMSQGTKDRPSRQLTLKVHDTTSNALIWTRPFGSDRPRQVIADRVSDRISIVWPARSDAAKDIAKENAAVRTAAARISKDDTFVEVVAAATGELIGGFFVTTGRIRHITWAGDLAVVVERGNQVSLYSLATGELRGGVFGASAVASQRAGLLAVQNDRRAIDLYDLATLERVRKLRLPATIRLARFDVDGRQLAVLTADQRVSFFDLTAQGATTP